MDLSRVVGVLLDPIPLPLETGYERLPDGVLHTTVRTDMHTCTGEMLELVVSVPTRHPAVHLEAPGRSHMERVDRDPLR